MKKALGKYGPANVEDTTGSGATDSKDDDDIDLFGSDDEEVWHKFVIVLSTGCVVAKLPGFESWLYYFFTCFLKILFTWWIKSNHHLSAELVMDLFFSDKTGYYCGGPTNFKLRKLVI